MSPPRLILRRFRALFRRGALDAEMSEEMRAHLELQAAENERRGMSAADARYAALRTFGGVEQIKERTRDQRGWQWVEQVRQDGRFAFRTFAKAPGFAAVAVLTLALGIGVSTALFSVVYGVLLAPFPYAKSGEIWVPEITDAQTGRQWGLRLADYFEIGKLPAVESAMAGRFLYATLSGGTNPEILDAPRVTTTAFGFLGVAPLLGRGLGPADLKPNGEPETVAVLSFRLWQRLFNGDRNVIGQTLILDGQPHAIIGVMPPRFTWLSDNGVWLPLATRDLNTGIRPLVRLKPGVDPARADEQLRWLLRSMAKQTPGPYPKTGFTAGFANFLDRSAASGEMRTSLHVLLYAVGFLLLIACANVANLQLARGAVRGREIAVRLAMGASRSRVMRQLLTESLVLALFGGAVGVFFAFGLTQAVVALMPGYYVPNEAVVTMNGWVLLFSLGLSVTTGATFGLAPGLLCTRPDLNDALKRGGHGAGTDVAGNRTRSVLVVAEVALSIVLLVGAALAIRGFAELQRVERGFRFEHLLIVRVPLDAKRYDTLERRNGFARDFIDRLRALAGVTSVTLGNLPGNEIGSGITIPGQPKIPDNVALNYVDADYLATLGIPLRAGRNLTADDIRHGSRVALVTETAAKLWADGRSPIGRSVAVDSLVGGGVTNLAPAGAIRDVTVVGVIADVRTRDKRRAPQAAILVPYSLRGPVSRAFLLRAQDDPTRLLNAVRAELRALDSELPLLGSIAVEQVFAAQAMPPRFNMILFTTLAAVALALAAAGIFSVLSYTVARRTREIGVRMALGATREDIVRLVVGAGAKMLVIGVVLGGAASVALASLLKSQIFNVPLLDPVAIGAAAITLVAGALLACWIPARRAAKIDPLVALRTE
jgi:putative ABC transport system permease protein